MGMPVSFMSDYRPPRTFMFEPFHSFWYMASQ